MFYIKFGRYTTVCCQHWTISISQNVNSKRKTDRVKNKFSQNRVNTKDTKKKEKKKDCTNCNWTKKRLRHQKKVRE